VAYIRRHCVSNLAIAGGILMAHVADEENNNDLLGSRRTAKVTLKKLL
jgi:hypothetical protein